jgi:hypothetical protein
MKIEPAHISIVKSSFEKMQTKEDLLQLLNEVKPLIYGDKTVPFDLKQLTWYANPKLSLRRYTEFKIKKKSGSERSIHAPIEGLKALQKTLSVILQCIFQPNQAAMGFVPNKSIVDNAKLHTGSKFVYNIDLKDFFPSVDQARVWKCLQLRPFNLNNNTPKSNRIQLANMLAAICCTEMEVERKNEHGQWELVKRNVLPQGAPTSPVITNIVCQRLDYLLTGVAKRFGLNYSRYADDITFSAMYDVFQAESDFQKEIHRIITEQGFHIKESKTRLQKDGYRKEVTGLLVNEHVNVQQRYIKQLRMWLYYWERYGEEKAYGFFLQQYLADKGQIVKGKPNMANVIKGKLDYLKMVKGGENELYLKLRGRFDKLVSKNVNSNKTILEPDLNHPLIKLPLSLNNEPLPEVKIAKLETFEKGTFQKSVIPIIHNPKELVALLKNFSVNDSALKYSTHSWDSGRDKGIFRDLEDFISKAKKEYSDFSFQLKGFSKNLNGKIYNFLFNRDISIDGWGVSRIKFGWSSPELLAACKENIDLKPEDFIIPEIFQLQIAGKTIQKFKQVIDIFKNEIEIRDENSALLNLILQKHDHFLISFSDPVVSNLENKTFYTDIQWLGKALDLIFEGIQKYPQHPEVEYYVTENGNDKMVLNILHRNSFKTGLSIHDDKLSLRRGDFSTVKDKLMNLCDWSVESQFEEGFYRINYLVSDKEIQAHQKIESAQGFKHILTFYK